jgi:hypothetical protein
VRHSVGERCLVLGVTPRRAHRVPCPADQESRSRDSAVLHPVAVIVATRVAGWHQLAVPRRPRGRSRARGARVARSAAELGRYARRARCGPVGGVSWRSRVGGPPCRHDEEALHSSESALRRPGDEPLPASRTTMSSGAPPTELVSPRFEEHLALLSEAFRPPRERAAPRGRALDVAASTTRQGRTGAGRGRCVRVAEHQPHT